MTTTNYDLLQLSACFAQKIPSEITVPCFEIITIIGKIIANNSNNNEQNDTALMQSTLASLAFLFLDVSHGRDVSEITLLVPKKRISDLPLA